MPEQIRLFQVQRSNDRSGIVSQQRDRETRCGAVRVAMTTCISHGDVVAAFQVVGHTRPAQATIREAMQQEDRRLIVAVGTVIVNGDAIGLYVPLDHAVISCSSLSLDVFTR